MVTGFLIFPLLYSCSSLEKNIQNPSWCLFRKRLLLSYTLMVSFKIECLKVPLETPSGICLEKIVCVFGKQLINPCSFYKPLEKNACMHPLRFVGKRVFVNPIWHLFEKKCLYYISGVSLENSGYDICLEKNA